MSLTIRNSMADFVTEWQVGIISGGPYWGGHDVAVGAAGYNRPAYIMTTDPDSGADAQDLAVRFGLDLQIRFPSEGWPTEAAALFIELDELMEDLHGRRKHLARIRLLKLPFPIIVLSYDFYPDPPTVVRPGLMFAVRLNDDVCRALLRGHIDPPYDQRKAS
jgi:hypothetical protein